MRRGLCRAFQIRDKGVADRSASNLNFALTPVRERAMLAPIKGRLTMERSVTERRRTPQSRRVLYSALGVLVGVSLGALVVFGFDFLLAAR